MASLSDARFSLPDPDVAVASVTAGVDTSTANAISAFGQIGGEAFKGVLEGQLLNQLQDTGDIINTINQGEDAVKDAIRKKQIDPTTERFQRLASAAEQGKISEQRAAIEAEVVLRQSIAKAPGFADHFRQTAREVLGFDPTSATLNSLFLSGPDANSTRQTQEQKDMEQAQAMYSAGAVGSVEEGFKLINQNRAAELRQSINSAKIAEGAMSAPQIAVEGANRAQSAMNGVMLEAFAQIRNTGGIQDVEAFRSSILASREAVKSKIENEMASSTDYVYGSDAYGDVRDRVDEVAEAYIALIDNQDFVKMLSRKQDQLQSVVEIAGVALAPDLAILAPFGENAVSSYLELMQASGGDPRIIKELMARDPQYAFLGNLQLKATDLAPALQGAATRALGGMVESGVLDKVTAQAVARHEAISNPTPEDVGRIVNNLSELEMPVTALSKVAKTPNSYAHMDETDRVATMNTFRTVYDQQMFNIQSKLDEAGFELGFVNGKFVVNDPQNRSISTIDPMAPQNFSTDLRRTAYTQRRLANLAGVAESVDLLNNTLAPVMKDRRWSMMQGAATFDQWTEQTVGAANSGMTPEEYQQSLRGQLERGEISAFGRIERNQQVDQRTLDAEGFSPTVYNDPGLGFRTIGYGHNLDAKPLTPEQKQTLGIDPAIPDDQLNLTEEQALQLYRMDVQEVVPQIRQSVPEFTGAPRAAQRVMVDMAFNMGPTGLANFSKMREAIAAGDWNKAADELLDSDYARGYVRKSDGTYVMENGKKKVLKGLVARAKANAEELRSLAK